MAANLGDFRKWVDDKVLDGQFGLNGDGNDQFIVEALKIFEDDHPKKGVVDVAVATPANEFALPSGPDLSYGMDGIIAIEYPIMESTDSRPRYIWVSPKWGTRGLNNYGFHLYSTDSTTVKIRFSSQLSEDFRLSFRKPYTVSLTTSDVPAHLDHILALLAASLKARHIGQRLMQKKDYSRPEDFVNYAIGGRDFLALAKDLRAEYDMRIGPYRFRLSPETVETRRVINRVYR